MRPRYYCDFCKKGNGSPSHMRKHEKGCTLRPDRTCGMCAASENEQPPLADLTPLALVGDLKALEEKAGHCPACILAAIRQAPWTKKTVEDEVDGRTYSHTFIDFPEAIAHWDYKAAVKSFWADVNDANADHY